MIKKLLPLLLLQTTIWCMESHEISQQKSEKLCTLQIANNETVTVPVKLLKHASTFKTMLKHRKEGLLIKSSPLQIPGMDKESWDLIEGALKAVESWEIDMPAGHFLSTISETQLLRLQSESDIFYYCKGCDNSKLLALTKWSDVLGMTSVLQEARKFKLNPEEKI